MEFDKPLQWSQAQSFGRIPEVRWGHSMTVLKNKIYLFGGRDGRFAEGYAVCDAV